MSDSGELWWTVPGNMLTLFEYLEQEPAYVKADMLAAAEKPWKYTPEFERAHQLREESRS